MNHTSRIASYISIGATFLRRLLHFLCVPRTASGSELAKLTHSALTIA